MLKVKRDNTYCAVPQCNSTGGKYPDLSFFKFPNAIYRENCNSYVRNKCNLQRRQEWIRMLRIGKEISERSVVCSKHFKKTDFSKETDRNGMKRRRLRPSAVPSQCLPISRPLEDEKVKKKKKQSKNSVSKSRKISKTGITDASSEIQKTPSIDSKSYSVLNYRFIDSHKAPHLPTSNENSYINISDSSAYSSLLEKAIKVEVPWEKEYNFVETFTNENERCDGSDQDEVESTPSTLSAEDPENSMQDISTEKIFLEKDSSSESIESRKISDRNEEKVSNNVFSEGNIKRKNEELSGRRKYFNAKKLERCKIEPREETFGRFIACEMSDLSEDPVLYLKTKQIILRALIDAHTELTNSYL